MTGRGVSWDAWRVFLAVHRIGSLTGAAHELGMAQATVSDQVASLERRLGYRLFDRTRSGVVTTVRGRDLAASLHGAVDALAEATATIEGDAEVTARTVHLGGPAEFLSELVLPPLMAVLPPSIRLVARFGLADDLIDALEEGAVDVLVSAVQPRRSGIAFTPLYDEEFFLVGHPRWRAQASENLDSVPVLAYAPDLPIIRRYWRSVFDRRPTQLRTVAIVPDLRELTRLAAEGVGMTVLPDYLARSHLVGGDLVLLDAPATPPLNTLYLATRRTGAHRGTAVETVRGAIASSLRERPA